MPSFKILSMKNYVLILTNQTKKSNIQRVFVYLYLKYFSSKIPITHTNFAGKKKISSSGNLLLTFSQSQILLKIILYYNGEGQKV
jgi:hypothetical protein